MKRALLIGSEVHGLKGVTNDLDSMEAVLREVWGFEDIVRCEGSDATRAGILSSLESLIDRASRGDIAVVHYSGHGARAREIDLGEKRYRNAEPLPEFIVPTDIDATKEGDFRGITSLELSMLARKLWRRTGNVTTIMDCCHSGIIVRGSAHDEAKPMVRFLPNCSVGIGSHLAAVKESLGTALPAHAKASRIVRLSACTPAQVAFEAKNEEGRITGALTHAVQRLLREVHGQNLSWRFVSTQLSIALRARRLGRRQDPSISGPIDQLVFGRHEQRTQGIAAIYYNRELRVDKAKTLCLLAGSLVGVHPGDEYLLMPNNRPFWPDEERRATATVAKVFPDYSTLTLTSTKKPNEILVNGAPARLVKTSRPTAPVTVSFAAEANRALCQALAESMYLHMATANEVGSAIATVDELDNGFAVSIKRPPLEQSHERVRMWSNPRPNTSEGIQALVADLERWAHAYMLLSLGEKSQAAGFASKFSIEWGHVIGGEARLCNEADRILYQNDHLYLRLCNPGSRKVYASVFHVGLTGDIALLTSDRASGIEMETGKEWLLGTTYRGLQGWQLGWPLDAADDGPRVEHLVAVLCERPLDLSVLETAKPQPRTVRHAILGEAHYRLRYRVERIDYRLSPERRPGSPDSAL